VTKLATRIGVVRELHCVSPVRNRALHGVNGGALHADCGQA